MTFWICLIYPQNKKDFIVSLYHLFDLKLRILPVKKIATKAPYLVAKKYFHFTC